jgi:four helix bundle protein
MGSAKEMEYQLLLAKDLGYILVTIHETLAKEVDEVERMLSALISTIRRGSA